MNLFLHLFFTFTIVLAQIQHQDLAKMLFLNQIQTWIPQCRTNQSTINNIDGLYVQMTISRFNQSILPSPYPSTTVFGYGCDTINPLTGSSLGFISNAPGPTLKAFTGQYLSIKYTNNIKGNHLFAQTLNLMMDPYITINTSKLIGVPVTVHLHGQIANSLFDGYPSSYATSMGTNGPFYYSVQETSNNSFIFQYPNLLKQAFLFYHDHAIGFTSLNNYAGMNGIYLIQTNQTTHLNIIDTYHDIILAIQDRTFNYDGSLKYPDNWQPQVYGDTIIVNSKVWPFMQVENGHYRLRILNGCNARVINITFVLSDNTTVIPFTIVKADAQYLDESILMTSSLIFPGERYQILINFTFPLYTSVYLINNQIPDYPDQNPFDQPLIGNIMRFDLVKSYSGNVTITTPIINNNRVLMNDPEQIREIVIIEDFDANGNLIAGYLDGHDASVAYIPFILGSIYQIHIINLTPDVHPIHIHLGRFQIVKRLEFDNAQYKIDFLNLNGPLPYQTSVLNYPVMKNYLTGNIFPPIPIQFALRDIIRAYPSQVSIVRIRFAMPDGSDYPIDVTTGPGYGLHCHILEHEDNSMMLLFKISPKPIDNKEIILNMLIVVILCFISMYLISNFKIIKKYNQKVIQNKQDQLKIDHLKFDDQNRMSEDGIIKISSPS